MSLISVGRRRKGEVCLGIVTVYEKKKGYLNLIVLSKSARKSKKRL